MPLYVLNQLVIVESRTGPNQNRPGGVARVTGCSAEGLFDVKYVIGGGYEKQVCQRFIRAYASTLIPQPRQKRAPSRLISEESDDEGSKKQGTPSAVRKRVCGLGTDNSKLKPKSKPNPKPQLDKSANTSRPAMPRPAMSFPVCNRPPFAIDQLVSVSSRTGPGENSPGGIGRITKVTKMIKDAGHSAFTFDVKYVIGGSEKNIAARHMAAHNPLVGVVSRSPKIPKAPKAEPALKKHRAKPSAKGTRSSKATKPSASASSVKKVVVKKIQARMKAGTAKKTQTPSKQRQVLATHPMNKSFSPCGASLRTGHGASASHAPESWTPIGEMFLSGRRSLAQKRVAPVPVQSQTSGSDNTADGPRPKRTRQGQVDNRVMNSHGCRPAGVAQN